MHHEHHDMAVTEEPNKAHEIISLSVAQENYFFFFSTIFHLAELSLWKKNSIKLWL